MLLEIDFAKKKKKPNPPTAKLTALYPVENQPKDKGKKVAEHLTLSI